MNLSAENIGAIRELVRSGYPLKARDAKDLLGHNDHLVELLEARGRLMLAVEIERDQLNAENGALRKDAERYRWLRIDDWWRSPMCVIRNPKDQAKLGSDCPSSDRLDAAIDAAIGKGEQS